MHKIVPISMAWVACWALAVPAPGSESTARNGRRFDPGRAMTTRAPGAPAELDRVAGFVGQWDVAVTRPQPAGEPLVTSGQAEISFMNRGHALIETFQSEDPRRGEFAAIAFLGYNPATNRWWLGGADSVAESVWVADGAFTGARLVLADSRRLNGGVTRTEFRHTLEQTARDALAYSLETSNDGGASWQTLETRTYSRRPPAAEFMAPASLYGSPAPDRPTEAAGFDFLIGEWDNAHDMTFPNGQQAQWSANGTAVYALDGAAILEYNWFDVDPNLPDAATTILRIYNRAMRRWECLFAPNRGHSLLYFGGRQEGERIVLGNFEIDSAAATIPHYVFHSIAEDSYAWYAESSTDRGATWTKTWRIEGRRKSGS